ncbi:hypothetical protein Tco_0206289 [Tanacetum coccineum]
MKKENMSIEEMRREQLMVDDEIKDISNYLSYKRFRDTEKGAHFNGRKGPLVVSSNHDLFQSICDDDESIPSNSIISQEIFFYNYFPFLKPIEKPDNSLSMGDEHLDTIPSVENLVPIPNVILREKLLNISRLITNIESLKDNPTPDRVFKSPSSFPILVVDSDSFFEESDTSLSHLIEPNQEGLISIDNLNDPLLELPEFESFHFDLYPSFPRPPPEPPMLENQA